MDDIFSDENKPESNWVKLEKVGDRVSGVIMNIESRGPSGDFVSQIVYTLEQSDGSVVNYGFKKYKDEKNGDLAPSYVADRLRNARVGDKVGFLFEKEIPPTKAGRKPAKSIQPFLVQAQ
jgi:hypothetical protein